MRYEQDLVREADITQTSIANTELCSILELIKHSRNDEAKFYDYIAYAKELQRGLYDMEICLKDQLRKAKK